MLRQVCKVCSACAGATAGYFLRNRQLQGARQQLGRLALVVGLNFLLGSSQGSMIDNSGHLGGLAVSCLHATPAVDLCILFNARSTEPAPVVIQGIFLPGTGCWTVSLSPRYPAGRVSIAHAAMGVAWCRGTLSM